MKIKLLLLSLIFFINCSYFHPPISVDQVNSKNDNQHLISQLMKNSKENNEPIPGSVSVLPFEEKGKKTGLGLAATEFFTSNISLFSQFTLIDRSMTNTLEQELAHFSPEKKKQALCAEQLVQGEVNLNNKKLAVSGDILHSGKSKKMDGKNGNAEQFFQMIADLNIQFFENNGIVVSDEIANQLYEVPTENIRAYVHYAEGRYQESIGNFKAAVSSYRQAANLDSDFEEPNERMEKVENQALTEGQNFSSKTDMLEEVLVEPLVMQPNLEERAVPMPAAVYKVNINFELP